MSSLFLPLVNTSSNGTLVSQNTIISIATSGVFLSLIVLTIITGLILVVIKRSKGVQNKHNNITTQVKERVLRQRKDTESMIYNEQYITRPGKLPTSVNSAIYDQVIYPEIDHVTTQPNVAYGHVTTQPNVTYDHVTTQPNIAYDHVTDHVTTQPNVAYMYGRYTVHKNSL